ncbi:hypothetical protein [Noviherbaspirillum saxi]|nr:hypothetical protein [Noviherbaspirillum saxi]
MRRITDLLANQEDLNIVLYVHGWKHGAETDDKNVMLFRQLLASMSRIERGYSSSPRRTVGIYVGWRGKSVHLPEPLISLTFWSRKSAAHRISNGSTRELLARLTGVQRYYNSKTNSKDCTVVESSDVPNERCRVRMLMIGHSFGAWILYSAVHNPLIESLSGHIDLSGDRPEAGDRAERAADMIVLVNPAFEASTYESLHRVAHLHKASALETPLLVSVTSTSDRATRNAFPFGHFFNALFEQPVSSDEQAEAMLHTHGHIERYVTHRLIAGDTKHCPDWVAPEAGKPRPLPVLQNNKKLEIENNRQFLKTYTQNGLLTPEWKREFCGKMVLTQLKGKGHGISNPNSLVWNIGTDNSVIKGHSDIMNVEFLDFIRQLYSDNAMFGHKGQSPTSVMLGNEFAKSRGILQQFDSAVTVQLILRIVNAAQERCAMLEVDLLTHARTDKKIGTEKII